LKTSNLKGYDAVVYGNEAQGMLPSVSTIVDLVDHDNPKIVREGVIPKEKIFAVLNEFS
jgi:tRNA A37 threonylcarbamoyladenosine synthetase subunit TsaC/SUA5/YrdC